MSNPLKLIVIVGSTASGKSELAVKIAEKFNGEIISADSRQIYRGLDIGTGKVTGAWSHAPVIPADAGIQGIKNKESGFPIKACPRPDRGSGMTKQNNREVFLYKNIPHHCIDCVSPKKIFTVAEYKKCAEAGIKDIAARGKLPIMAGGTGFWIDAVAYNMQFPRVPPNDALRKRLKKKSADKLFEMLKHSDPERAKTIDKKNPRRLIRAIEIALALGKVPRMMRASPYRILWIGLKKSPEELKKKISARLRARIKQGMIREGERLRKQGISWKRLYELG
ncbi:MAG: hypothetical protein HYZ69_01355, partial [Candidatus Colwellbacteria bacterium]|nr:hypothetical protein [Candidatus Colwellbacteria bacterium]